MYRKVKKQIFIKTAIMVAILLGMALMAFVFGAAKIRATSVGMKGVYFTIVIIAVFAVIAIYTVLSHYLGLKSMLSSLGNPSDDEMEQILEQAEPADERDVPLIYLTEDHILNFESLRAYEFGNIRSVKQSHHSSGSDTSSDYYDVVIKLDGKPRKDIISFSFRSQRDHVYNKIKEACEMRGIHI